MKLDERFMTILTALLVIIGVGAVMTSGENGSSLLGGKGSYLPKDDSFTLRAGRVQSLDVLLNDENADRVDFSQMRVVRPASCGTAIAAHGAIQYSDSSECAGTVTFAYCVPFEERCNSTDVVLNVLQPNQTLTVAGAGANSGPRVVSSVRQGIAPREEQPQIAAAQPMRLTLPSTAEVITPKEATAEVRRIGMETVSVAAVSPENSADEAVKVSNTSARSGSVSVQGTSLNIPVVGEANSGVAIASVQDSRPSGGRSMQPGGLAMSGMPATAPGSGFVPPTRPDAPAPAPIATARVAPEAVETAPTRAEIAAATPEAEVPAPAATQPARVDLDVATVAPSIEPVATPDEIPGNTGVIASLARSNTVFGATVSAAKALFAPEASDNRVRAGASAPRPQGMANVAQPEVVLTEEDAVAGIGNAGGEVARNVPQRATAPIVVAELSPAPDAYRPKTAPAAPIERIILSQPEARPAPVEEQKVVSLPPTVPAPGASDVRLELPEMQANSDASCGIDLTLQVNIGAEIVASLFSPCRPEQRFLVEHSGLAFEATTDIDGFANFVVPAMVSEAVVRVAFPDGGTAFTDTAVESMSRMRRIAVVWNTPVDLDLHALEFGAATGSDWDIWSGNPRDYRMSRRAGGGYLTSLGLSDGSGVQAEVYTIFDTLRTKDGDVNFDLKVADPDAGCDASPVIRLIDSDSGDLRGSTDTRVNLGACGDIRSVDISDTLGPIRIVTLR